ncbi:hypothetical protein M3J09_008675 [Ascochyta lentis]
MICRYIGTSSPTVHNIPTTPRPAVSTPLLLAQHTAVH